MLNQIQDKEERVIFYSSQSKKAAEQNYSAIEREFLAIVWATALFRPYLYNSELDVITDHNPLIYLQTLTMNSSRLTK